MDNSHTTSKLRLTGAIRGLKNSYGFIAGDDGRDYFFHWSAMEATSKNFRELKMQERVEFLPFKNTDDRWRAVEIRVI